MKLKVITASIVLIFFALSSLVVNASIQDMIDATVSIAICGNDLVEGAEQCDGLNLAGSTCQNIGYDSGSLICDNACDFDVTVCSFVATPASTIKTDINSELVVDKTTNLTSSSISQPILIKVPKIPLSLTKFDANNNGIIDSSELATAIGIWVGHWRDKDEKGCDLNSDRECNLMDFSVLLYYTKP